MRSTKASHLVISNIFTPVVIETLGAIGPKSMVFWKELGRHIRAVTDEPKSADYLLQRIAGTVLLCRAALAPDFVF